MSRPTVKGIVQEYLDKNGYSGLCNEDCGCLRDDLFCCMEQDATCVPGHKAKCKLCGADLVTYDGEDADGCNAC